MLLNNNQHFCLNAAQIIFAVARIIDAYALFRVCIEKTIGSFK